MSATQPITLITATPGGGKTALAVQMMKAAVDQGRPLFVMGIPELETAVYPDAGGFGLDGAARRP